MEEKVIWKGSPSQWTNFNTFLLCAIGCWLIFPIFIALYAYLKVSSKQIEITTERYVVKEGIFTKITHQVEFYRIKDVILEEPFLLRMVNLANLEFVSSDTMERFEPMKGIPDGEKIREEVRNAIEAVRERKKVFVRDI